MGTEITRASDADRERFAGHLSVLYGKGYITEAEAEEIRQQILRARSLSVLESALSGFPQPENQRPKTDWGMPERFLPACIAAGITGIMVAVVPVTALAHRGDSLSNVLSAVSIITGLAIVVVALIVAVCAGCSWDDAGASERYRRREEQKRR
jgi:hypothetical protein